jgi:hypothetical protein
MMPGLAPGSNTQLLQASCCQGLCRRGRCFHAACDLHSFSHIARICIAPGWDVIAWMSLHVLPFHYCAPQVLQAMDEGCKERGVRPIIFPVSDHYATTSRHLQHILGCSEEVWSEHAPAGGRPLGMPPLIHKLLLCPCNPCLSHAFASQMSNPISRMECSSEEAVRCGRTVSQQPCWFRLQHRHAITSCSFWLLKETIWVEYQDRAGPGPVLCAYGRDGAQPC